NIAHRHIHGTLENASCNGQHDYDDALHPRAKIRSVPVRSFENLAIGTASATAHVNDTIDPTTVNLSASTVLEGAVANYTFTATRSEERRVGNKFMTRGALNLKVNSATIGRLRLARHNDEHE